MQSPEVQAFAQGFPLSLVHALIALALLVLGVAAHALLGPHKDIPQIRAGNTAAALSLGGIVIGLAAPLATAMAGSASLAELVLWGLMTVIVQLLVFRLIDMALRGLPERIAEGEMSAAVLLTSAKLAVALILAAAVAG
jgi:putative membrane protein